ncbi:LIC10260 family lipoprotein [Leptospira interrogans]|uniref:Putative lipoprotein n=1 Tax=Leptospira interrogans str. 2006001854 TaxID=1001590 RepID=M6GEY5_LEPIR|nr:hypothetical protein [Leptospira interrogans]EMM83350.1 putative lipoprotein [Leptospira interrogans str. 2006001854]EKR35874.1 putative lipoprotein [Leptospira interrogans serovar Hebdomadis str. R499]EKR84085.1 putative lipoprotein [Leptospira interrogans str. UI 08452]EMN36016.1 putative lipoprotein [Leptospira interrogans serovar Medanensis str. L0448]EMN41142.1 putative lipoprotein [Leptospira interrogans str. L0996]
MKVFRITTLTLILMILISCSQNVKRISYVSVDKPKDGILSNENRSVEFGKFRFGIVYIPPVGVHPYLKEAEIQSGSTTLRNVDVVMRPGFCLLPLMPMVCFTRYSIIVESNPVQSSP